MKLFRKRGHSWYEIHAIYFQGIATDARGGEPGNHDSHPECLLLADIRRDRNRAGKKQLMRREH